MPLIYVSSRQKEAAALKIKATASNARENMSALRRLFFFCRRPADIYKILMNRYYNSLIVSVIAILRMRFAGV